LQPRYTVAATMTDRQPRGALLAPAGDQGAGTMRVRPADGIEGSAVVGSQVRVTGGSARARPRKKRRNQVASASPV
jgi:hypothetical protein